MNKNNSILIFTLIFIFLFGCENPWDEHVKVNDDVLQESIVDYLSSQSEFSKFVELLEETGFDVMLSSSVIYTVWAPTNDAIDAVDQSFLATPEKKELFVQNHIVFGNFSSKEGNEAQWLTMRSGKVFYYDATNAKIGEAAIDVEQEKKAGNGTVQVIGTALCPLYSVWEYINLEADENEYVSFIKSLTTLVFYEDSSEQIGVNDYGLPVYDSVWVEENPLLKYYVDISSEDLKVTLLIPSDEVFRSEFSKYEQYFRKEDKRNNEVPSSKDSVYIKLMIARDMIINGSYPAGEAGDTLLSFYGIKVPFIQSAVTNSYKASNGYVHYTSDCYVKISDKIKPLIMEAEYCVYSVDMASGSPCPYYRLRDDASNGMDFICDNSNTSAVLSGVVFAGPVLSSIKYRIKIRAIDDFGKSYRNSDTSVVLIQKLGTVTVIRDSETSEIKTVSEVTNSLNYTNTLYGSADVSSDTISITLDEYSPIGQAENDEIDLGFYQFNKSDNIFLRLIPLSTKMAVTADYFRLVPIIE